VSISIIISFFRVVNDTIPTIYSEAFDLRLDTACCAQSFIKAAVGDESIHAISTLIDAPDHSRIIRKASGGVVVKSEESKRRFDSAPSSLSEFGQSSLICLKSHTRSHKSPRVRSLSFGPLARRGPS
jgi:hypothetical protein